MHNAKGRSHVKCKHLYCTNIKKLLQFTMNTTEMFASVSSGPLFVIFRYMFVVIFVLFSLFTPATEKSASICLAFSLK